MRTIGLEVVREDELGHTATDEDAETYMREVAVQARDLGYDVCWLVSGAGALRWNRYPDDLRILCEHILQRGSWATR
jgi:alkanesulfonate monooxygenase SsuD/methylene tetrahydromethanopterin reductase-like flavin-dependent oxidoreductase (luciferase family)